MLLGVEGSDDDSFFVCVAFSVFFLNSFHRTVEYEILYHVHIRKYKKQSIIHINNIIYELKVSCFCFIVSAKAVPCRF